MPLRPERGQAAGSLLLAGAFLLPTAFPQLFSWIGLLLAVPVFLLLQNGEEARALRQLRQGLMAVGAAALLLGHGWWFLFLLAAVPLGWTLHRSAQSGADPAAAGGAGLAVLSGCWLVFWTLRGLLTGVNPYASLLADLDSSLEQLMVIYRSSGELSGDLLQELELAAAALQKILPKVLPGLLASSAVFTVWLNLTVSSGLLRRLRPKQALWPEYRIWRLPDNLIWLLIAAALLAMTGAGGLETAGYSLAAVMLLLYFFQGAAVFAALLCRWNVPVFWRIVLYIFAAAQGCGILLLTVAGAADTWADFRKLAQNGQPPSRS
uniref:DUF2232 domain-containing protein n=1 Tax=Candidatus Electronema sp. TaxID=2698783 RepID=UPI00405679E9